MREDETSTKGLSDMADPFASLINSFYESQVAANASVAVILAAIVIYYLYWLGTYKYQMLDKFNVPGYKPLPYIGNLLEFKKHGGPMAFQQHCFEKYGKVFSICYGRMPSIVVADPEILRQILVKDFQKFRNRSTPIIPPAPLNSGVFFAKDENWKRIRTILTPTFSASKLKHMMSKVERAVDTLMNKLDRVADSGEPIRVHQFYGLLALDVIMSTSFGYEGEVQSNADPEILKEARIIFGNENLRYLFQFLPIGFAKAAMMLSRRNYFIELANEIIQKRRQQDTVGHRDLMELMLNANESTDQGVSRLSDAEVTAQAYTFLLAGYHTTSRALETLTYFLVLHPDIQEKLFHEIEAVFQENPGDSMYDLVGKAKYMDCVLSESQRIGQGRAVPGNAITRYCAEGCVIKGVHFPKGAEVIIPIYLLHHDPVAWPDVWKFDPERFRDPQSESRHPFQFMPFGGGPRNCIGMRMALVEIKVTLAKVLREYKFVRPPGLQDFDVAVPHEAVHVWSSDVIEVVKSSNWKSEDLFTAAESMNQ